MRSLLFVPGDDERKIAKALDSAADALILDLEDAVAPQRKSGRARSVRVGAAQRENIESALRAHERPRYAPRACRSCGGRRGQARSASCCRSRAAATTCAGFRCISTRSKRAKASTPGSIRILPIVTETGGSMFGLGSYADPAIPRLFGMLWGGEDLGADVGAIGNRGDDGRYAPAYELARSLCLFGAAAAGVLAVDAVYTNFRDSEGLKAEALEGLRSGFGAKAAIHPAQVDVINEAFTPSRADVEWAQRVVAAFDAAGDAGVAAIDGKMLDRPHLRGARRTLERAREAGALD